MLHLWSLLFAFLVPRPVVADDHDVVFLYPPRGLTLYYLDTANVQYTSPFPKPRLFTFCDGGGRQIFVQDAVAFNGTMPILLNWTSSTPCWFDLRPNDIGGNGANSPSFVLLPNQRSQTTLGLSSTSPTSPTPTGAAAASAASGSGDTIPPSHDNELSSGAKAGIGIGVAVGVIGLVGAAGALLWRRRRASNLRDSSEARPAGWEEPPNADATSLIGSPPPPQYTSPVKQEDLYQGPRSASHEPDGVALCPRNLPSHTRDLTS